MNKIEFKDPYKYMVIDTCIYSACLEVVETVLYISKAKAKTFYEAAKKQHASVSTSGEVKLIDSDFKMLEECKYDYN